MTTDENLTGSIRVRKLQTMLHAKAKEEPDRRFHALIDKVWRIDFLMEAWVRVRRNGGSAGVDGERVLDVETYGVERWLGELSRDLREGTYANDGLAIRTGVKLPTGDESSLAGSGGYSASVWAETSGVLPGPAASRAWLYAATVGALAGEVPRGLADLGGRFIAFGRVGVIWRPLRRLTLTAQLDAHSSP